MSKIILILLALFSVRVFAEDMNLPKDSLYHVKSVWKDHNGHSLQLKDLKGQNVIITMVYTGCAHACPMMISKIQEIEGSLATKGVKDYRIILASFDTKKDTPEALKKYIKGRNLDEARWTFLSAPNESTARELAVVLGISYKEIGGGDFSHSNIISFLNKTGVLKGKLESLNSNIDAFVESIRGESR